MRLNFYNIKRKNKEIQPRPPPRLKFLNNRSAYRFTDPSQSLISQMSVLSSRLSLAMTQ